jgi:hypothetical protein
MQKPLWMGIREVKKPDADEGTWVVQVQCFLAPSHVAAIAKELNQLVIAAVATKTDASGIGIEGYSGLVDQDGNLNNFTQYGAFDLAKFTTWEQAQPWVSREDYSKLELRILSLEKWAAQFSQHAENERTIRVGLEASVKSLDEKLKAKDTVEYANGMETVLHQHTADLLGVTRGDLVSMRAAMRHWRINASNCDKARSDRIYHMLDALIKRL